jgi:hypothetical protein
MNTFNFGAKIKVFVIVLFKGLNFVIKIES